MNKRERHALIHELVTAQPVSSQEELRQLLKARGLDVTQSTLSRDLRELRLARIPTEQGVRYAYPDAAAGESERATLEDILPQFFASVDGVGELLVIRTVPGGAQPIAEAIDAEPMADVLGTLGGENTVLIICRSATAREKLGKRVERLSRAKS